MGIDKETQRIKKAVTKALQEEKKRLSNRHISGSHKVKPKVFVVAER